MLPFKATSFIIHTLFCVLGVFMLFSSWTAFFVAGLLLSQIIIFLVTVYFHRSMSHRAVVFSPHLNRVCRFLSWFLIAMDPQEFAAVHRKHHAHCDTEEDPHSPKYFGAMGVLFNGLSLYRKEAKKKETIEKYGKGLPSDPLENFYKSNPNLGILSFALLLTLVLGLKGTLLWGALMVWIPFWAAGVVNGLGHHVGYRNFLTDDLSTNLSPWGLWIGGEELHNNHHAYPSSAKFSRRWFEIDAGWGLIVVLKVLGLATVREDKNEEEEGVMGFLNNRYVWLARFHQAVHSHTKEELKALGFAKWKRVSHQAFSIKDLSQKRKQKLERLKQSPRLAQLLELEKEFHAFWTTRQHLSAHTLQMWKEKALNINLPSLNEFCVRLPNFPSPSPPQAALA